MKIVEIFNTKVYLKILKQTNDWFETEASVGDRKIIFTALNNDGEWELGFVEVDLDGRSSHGLTGRGHEFVVFSAVKDSLIRFIAEYNPQEFYFTAEKDDEGNGRNVRADLYDRIIKRISLPNYQYERKTGKASGRDFFYFVREV